MTTNALIFFTLLGQGLTTFALIMAVLQEYKSTRVIWCMLAIVLQTVTALCFAYAFIKM